METRPTERPSASAEAPLTLSEDGKTVLTCAACVEQVTLPPGVTAIGKWAFRGCNHLTRITLPPGLTTIGDWAFRSCTRLAAVDIPQSVSSIGRSAFSGCTRLASLTLPEGLALLGPGAFEGCKRVTAVTLPASLTDIADDAFAGCKSLNAFQVQEGNPAFYTQDGVLYRRGEQDTLVAVPEALSGSVTIPEGVTSIERKAFSGLAGLTGVTLPRSLRSIGRYAFSDCYGLSRIDIPESVTGIGENAFYNCAGLSRVTLPVRLLPPGSAFSCGFGQIVSGSSLTVVLLGSGDIPDYAFSHCASLSGLVISEGITAIGDYAFYGCVLLRELVIPDSVDRIGEHALYGTAWYDTQSDGLIYAGKFAYKYKGPIPDNTTLSIRNGTAVIAPSAFAGCGGLSAITIPESVSRIGENAFSHCAGLTRVTFEGSRTSLPHPNTFPSGASLLEAASSPAGGFRTITPGTYTRPSGGASWRKQ